MTKKDTDENLTSKAKIHKCTLKELSISKRKQVINAKTISDNTALNLAAFSIITKNKLTVFHDVKKEFDNYVIKLLFYAEREVLPYLEKLFSVVEISVDSLLLRT